MGLFVALRLFQRRDLRFREHDAVLRHFRLQRLEPMLHRRQVVALPHTAHTGWRDRQAALAQFVGHPQLAPGRLFDRKVHHRPLNVRRGTVLQARLAPADLLQRQLATFVIELFETIEAVPTVAHHLARSAHIAELLRQLQKPHLGPDNLLFLCHRMVSAAAAGGQVAVPISAQNRNPPTGSYLRKPTNTVRLSLSYYRSLIVSNTAVITHPLLRYCWRMPYAPIGSVISLLNADRRVCASGVLASQAPSRMRFMAAAVSTC